MLLVAVEPALRLNGLFELSSDVGVEVTPGDDVVGVDRVKCVPGPSIALGSGSVNGSMIAFEA